MSCTGEVSPVQETCGESDKRACNVEAHESTKRLERTLSKDHGDRIAGKVFNSLSHKYLVKKFIPMPQALQNPDAEAAVDREWEELEKLPVWHMTIVNSKKGCLSGSTKRAKNSPCCYADGHLSSQECGVRTEVSEIQSPGCTPR